TSHRSFPTRRSSDLHPLLADRVVKKFHQRRLACAFSAGQNPRGGHIVKRLAGPLQRWDHVLLVQAGPLVEIAVLAIDELRKLDRDRKSTRLNSSHQI